MSPLHLLWICPLCVMVGIFLLAFLVGSHDANEVIKAVHDDEYNYQFMPAAASNNK